MSDRTPSLADLQERYSAIVRQLLGPCASGPINTTARHDGSPHIEVRDGGWEYVVTDRGCELERRRATDQDDVLFWLVTDLTWGMAVGYELKHRRGGEDCRRVIFAKQLEWLHAVRPAWADRERSRYDRILAEHPFVDRPA